LSQFARCGLEARSGSGQLHADAGGVRADGEVAGCGELQHWDTSSTSDEIAACQIVDGVVD
jgi:hypothetical protein